jgi:hypothetical protein
MRKKMRKYQPGGTQTTRTGPAGPYESTEGVPSAPPVRTPANITPANASQPVAAETPVAPITSNATGQAPVAPAVDPLLAANEKYTKLGYRPRRARKLAMKEVNPLGKEKVSGSDVLNTISSGLDLATKGSNTIGAFRSAFQKNGGQMSGKELRKTSGFMKAGGSVSRQATRSAKKYDQAAKAYSKGNEKKGDRKMAKANKLAVTNKLAVAKKGGIKTRKR